MLNHRPLPERFTILPASRQYGASSMCYMGTWGRSSRVDSDRWPGGDGDAVLINLGGFKLGSIACVYSSKSETYDEKCHFCHRLRVR